MEEGLLTDDYYDPYEDDYDDYNGSEDGYDPCTKSYYDLNDENTCSHVDFKSLPPINKIKGFYDPQISKPCCISNQTNGEAFHGYLHVDDCEVYELTLFSMKIRLRVKQLKM